MVPVLSRVRRVDAGSLRRLRKVSGGGIRVDAQLTRTGVFQYLQPDGSIHREWRPPEEVHKPKSMQSLDCVPVGDDHPEELLTLEDEADYRKGLTGENTRRDGEWLVNSIIVRDPDLIKKMRRGKVFVSCGYDCDLEEKPGVTPEGERYDAIQRNITYNHVAIVDVPRAGSHARVRMDGGVMLRKDWDPDQPRAENGQFGEGGGGDQKSGDTEKKESSRDRRIREGQEDLEDLDTIKEATGLKVGTQIDQRANGTIILAKVGRGEAASIDKKLSEKGMSVKWNKSKTGGTVVRSHRRRDSKEIVMPNLAKKLARALKENEALRARADAADARADARDEDVEEDVEREDADEEDDDSEDSDEDEPPPFIKKKMKKDGVDFVDAASFERMRARADSLDAENKELRKKLKAKRVDSADIQARVRERVKLERLAGPILREDSEDDEIDLEKMSDREIKVAVIKEVDRKDCADRNKFTDEYVNARFDSVIERFDGADEEDEVEEYDVRRFDGEDADEEAAAARRMRARSANRWRGDSADTANEED